MATVIFLGAGASAADGAPTQSELFKEYFSASVSKPGRGDMDSQLATFFMLMFGVDVHCDNLALELFPSFEEAIGILDLAQMRGETLKDFDLESLAANSGRLRMVRYYLVAAMADVIADKLQSSTAINHRQLVEQLESAGLLKSTAFISTNYDILIDNAIAALSLSNPGERTDYAVEFANQTALPPWSPPGAYAVPLLKLHGSLNWLYCPTCNDLTITPLRKGAIEFITCNFCETLMVPIIVPPTFYKNMTNVFLGRVWNRAEFELRRADHVIFCGYSFPDADMHIKYLIKRAQTNRGTGKQPRFTVVNHFPGKASQDIDAERARYERFLRKVNYTSVSFEEFSSQPTLYYS
jgi:NAD-dependent SIR2 family protein deacetylase